MSRSVGNIKALSRPARPLRRFAKMLGEHFEGAVSYATFPLSNGALEGNNSRIHGLSHRVRGYRDKADLILAISHCCGKLNYA